jgi:hypothetical protein
MCIHICIKKVVLNKERTEVIRFFPIDNIYFYKEPLNGREAHKGKLL